MLHCPGFNQHDPNRHCLNHDRLNRDCLHRPALIGLLLLLLGGCALTVSSPRALLPIDGFIAQADDARVQVEPGFAAFGARVAAELPAAISTVEAAHYQPFAYAPTVYVCGTWACFKRWVKTPRLSAAVIPDNRLILSPNLNGREAPRLPGLLRHELAHLHLGQRIGHFSSALPVWFHEGWASLTASGGGAEFVPDSAVFAAIRDGQRISLTLRDTPDQRHRASQFGLSTHAFYRQAMLAVAWLKYRDEAKFRRFALMLQDNRDFDLAFWAVYGHSPARELQGFFDDAVARAPIPPPAP